MKKIGLHLYVCASSDWFENMEDVEVIKGDWSVPKSKEVGKSLYRKTIIKNYKRIKSVIEETQPDIIYIASYDIITLAFAFPYILKYGKKVYIQEHNNVDQIRTNKVKYLLYNIYKNCFHHLVLEEYIKDKLIELGVKKELVHVVPHPVTGDFYSNENNKKLVIGLSNSNDDSIIEKIIDNQKVNQCLSSSGYKYIIKSKAYSYNDDVLKVFNGWISSEEYTDYCHNCDCFIIPFSEKNYSYRVSNVFMEAISNNKKIISSRFPLTEYYAKKYPGICYIFDQINQIPALLNDYDLDLYQKSRIAFINNHSDNAISEAFIRAFNVR